MTSCDRKRRSICFVTRMPSGIKAAHLVAERLAARPIVAVYTSPSRRSVETVEPLAPVLGLTLEVVFAGAELRRVERVWDGA